jgi:hypothetical protein
MILADEMIVNNILGFHQWMQSKNIRYPSNSYELRKLAEQYIQESYYPKKEGE